MSESDLPAERVRSRERLSALMDGEADRDLVQAVCRQWRQDEDDRAQWHAYHLIGDVLRSEDLGQRSASDAAFLAGVRERLAREPVVLAPQPMLQPEQPREQVEHSAQVVGLPVTSVAERLPAGQYQYFSALRAKLGMQIYPYDQHGLVETLADDVHSGRVACLVADRDFGRHGLAVSWPAPGGARELTVPPGPVLIAQRTGADLVPIAAWFVGNRTHLEIGEPIEHRPGVDGAGVMAQQMVDFFATQIAGHVTDWHMMQRFFPGEMA